MRKQSCHFYPGQLRSGLRRSGAIFQVIKRGVETKKAGLLILIG